MQFTVLVAACKFLAHGIASDSEGTSHHQVVQRLVCGVLLGFEVPAKLFVATACWLSVG
jgi:hypothetical protein